MGDDLIDITGQPGPHCLLIRNGLTVVVALMEEPGGHIRIPDQNVSADADAVLLRPGDHFIRPGIVHAGHAVPALFGSCLIQQGICLGLIGAGKRVEMTADKVHIGGIPETVIAEAGAQPESVGLGEGTERIIVLGNRTGGFAESRQREAADRQSGNDQQHAAQKIQHGDALLQEKMYAQDVRTLF